MIYIAHTRHKTQLHELPIHNSQALQAPRRLNILGLKQALEAKSWTIPPLKLTASVPGAPSWGENGTEETHGDVTIENGVLTWVARQDHSLASEADPGTSMSAG